MSEFDWAGLWAEACEAYDAVDVGRAICAERDQAAAAYLRERIEAAFVPRVDFDTVENAPSQAICNLTARAEAAEARVKVLEEALVAEREEALWNAYNTGYVKDGRWSHMFMSDGEWLAAQCHLNPRDPDYDDASIRAAIPFAARQALRGEHADHG